tara:strand:+ start:229 stop:390 length:162 start_codon:yes stop_codon:yes gene_type:complete
MNAQIVLMIRKGQDSTGRSGAPLNASVQQFRTHGPGHSGISGVCGQGDLTTKG